MARDPVCGMKVDEQKAAARAEYQGMTFYFCSPGCQKSFASDPQKYLRTTPAPGAPKRGR